MFEIFEYIDNVLNILLTVEIDEFFYLDELKIINISAMNSNSKAPWSHLEYQKP
jgi:hypothetical protein